MPGAANFTLARTELEPLQDQQVLVRKLFNMITKRLKMKGFIVPDWLDRQGEFEREVGGCFRAGKLKHKETAVEEIGQAVRAFLGLFQGQNVGKKVVKLI